MKSTPLIVAIILTILVAGGCGYDRELLGDQQPEPAQEAPEEPDDDSYTTEPPESLDVGMFSELKFYGSWYPLDPFGWVWRPIVTSDWAPFVYGHWVWTSYGWMWISYDTFGWATCHYGYWTRDFTLGWVWIPDYQWSPCAVDWVVYDDYICWSPVPPPGVRFKDPWVEDRYNPWITVREKNFMDPDVGRYQEPAKFKTGYSERTLRRRAPESGEIAKVRGSTVPTVDVALERTVVGEHEFARVMLPPDQQQIVDQHRFKTTKSPPAAKASPPATTPEKPKTTPSKSTKSTKKKDTSKPQSYKTKAKEDKAKQGEETKGEKEKEPRR